MLYRPIKLYVVANICGVELSFSEVILMWIRRIRIKEVVDGLIISHKAGLGIKRDELEAFALAGGNIKNVTFGMIAAQKAGIELTFKKACNADFNGIQLLEVIQKQGALDENSFK